MHRGVGWKRADDHEFRFRLLGAILADAGTRAGVVINDLGCGYGALFDAFRDIPCLAGGRYLGYDINPRMLMAARARIDDPRARFIESFAATETADFSFVSGTYNIKMRADEETWLAYVEASLLDLWEKTRLGLAFNMMSSRGTARENTLYYADPLHFLAFCQDRLSPRVQLRHDYHLPEFTIFVYR
jgi:SAM-dependent methyltransferase